MGIFKSIIQLVNREYPTKTLIKRGLKVGKGFSRQQGCFIDPSHCWLITIGDNVTFSIRVTVLAHDASMKQSLGYARIAKVNIDDNVFLGANTTILPGVHIGEGTIIGANSVVTKDIPAVCVAVGNPAKVLCSKEDWLKRIKTEYEGSLVFEEEYTERMNVTDEKKNEMIERMGSNSAFIV